MTHLSVRFRLGLLVACMAILLLIVGGLGFYSASMAVRNLHDTYEEQTIPMRLVARIRRLHVDNESHIFKAFQHNPQYEYAKLHDHPLANHTEVIEKNLKWAEESWEELIKRLPADSAEAPLAREIHASYQKYLESTLRPVLKRLAANDFSQESVAAFLKANNESGKAMDKAFRELADVQQQEVKKNYELAMAQTGNLRNWSIATVVLGIAAGLLMALTIVRSIVRPLEAMRTAIDHAASQNDFTDRIAIAGNDEIGATAKSFNHLMATLSDSLKNIRSDMIRVDDALQTLKASADQAASASTATSESASAMAASVEEMSVSITSVSDSTNEALNIAQAAGERANTGGQVIDDTVSEIGQISQLIERASTTITNLGASSDRISSVVQVIKDVADQTNLLALNAAIEAARAGEAGRGFAVVADEVRKLAERTTSATGEIAEMISDIQNTSRSAVDIMADTVTRVGKGAEHAESAGQAIGLIRENASEVARVVHDIADAMSEQGAASQDIARRVENVAQASEESNASVQDAAQAVRAIHEVSRNMRNNVERFRV